MKRFVLLLAPIVLLGCSPAQPPPPPAVSFNTAIPIQEVMAHVMDPAAYQFWGGSGTLVSGAGIVDLAPTTEEGWKHVEDGAATVVLVTNSLKVQGYSQGAEWDKYADKVAAVALRAKAAVEAKDSPAMLTIGEELDLACEACHKRYVPNYQ